MTPTAAVAVLSAVCAASEPMNLLALEGVLLWPFLAREIIYFYMAYFNLSWSYVINSWPTK